VYIADLQVSPAGLKAVHVTVISSWYIELTQNFRLYTSPLTTHMHTRVCACSHTNTCTHTHKLLSVTGKPASL